MPVPALTVLFEHPEWQRPLFSELGRRRIPFVALDLKRGAFGQVDTAPTSLVFNQASPSAYARGNPGAVPFAMACIRHFESQNVRVLNGSSAFALELSKSAQIDLMNRLGVDHPRSIVFNDVEALAAATTSWAWPSLLKPDQGGSGARMFLVESLDEVRRLFRAQPDLWRPDHLFLLQEYFPRDVEKGIVRMEFLGGELLYAMRVVAAGGFNLCPSEVCHPTGDEESVCAVPAKVDFVPFPEVPAEAVETGKQLVRHGGLDVGGIEYLEARDGRRIFFDINANSNLRPAVADAFGFDPFARVVDYLEVQIG